MLSGQKDRGIAESWPSSACRCGWGSGRARPYNLDVRIPDIVTPPIAWQPEAAERFGIRKVELEILQQRHEAWIYVRNFPSHRSTTQWWKFQLAINGLAPELRCTLHVDRVRPLSILVI